MTFRVVDTNVAIVASNRSQEACADCVASSIDALQDIIISGGVVVDDGMRIIEEYMVNLSLSGQPGPGDAFMKWVWLHQANQYRCEQVSITDDPSRVFSEFPVDLRLQKFDRSDRKFVAVALTSRNSPDILNAVDSDWWNHRQALADCGLNVGFCALTSLLIERNRSWPSLTTNASENRWNCSRKGSVLSPSAS